jgi:SAM-dependent methyltransferase
MAIRDLLKKSKDLQSIYDYIKIKFYTYDSIKRTNKYLQSQNQKKLHLGCGSNYLEGWLNTDYGKPNNKSIFLDVTKPFPFANNVFDFVMAEHLIEHIHYNDAKKMLTEIHRVLGKGGIVRIGTPSVEKYIQIYKNSTNTLENVVLKTMTDDWIRPGFYNAKNYTPPTDNYNPIFLLNDIFMNYEHKFIYNEMILSDLLQKAGFKNIKVEIAGISSHKTLNNVETHVDEINTFLTLTIEAQKN